MDHISMKKITLLTLVVATLSFAQQPTSFLEEIQQEPIDSPIPAAIIESANNNPTVISYAVLTDFLAGVSTFCDDDTLTFENFEGGPLTITVCGPSIGSFGNLCFDPGELEDGFVVESSDLDNIVFLPDGALANVDAPFVGAVDFLFQTIVKFDPEVYAVALDLWTSPDPFCQVRIFGADGNLIELLVVSTPQFSKTFIGIIADEPIKRIELEGAHNSAELFGNLYFGAVCDNVVGIEDTILSKIAFYPNPAENSITLHIPESIALQSIAVYDVFGRLVTSDIVNNQIDVSNFTQGIYLLTLKTSKGTITKKIAKS